MPHTSTSPTRPSPGSTTPTRRPRDLPPPVTPPGNRVPGLMHLHQAAARRERAALRLAEQLERSPRHNPILFVRAQETLLQRMAEVVLEPEAEPEAEPELRLSVVWRVWMVLKGHLGMACGGVMECVFRLLARGRFAAGDTSPV